VLTREVLHYPPHSQKRRTMKPDKPVIIKVGSKGAYVNLNNVLSFAILKDAKHQVYKDEEAVKGELYTADTIAFYFIGGSSLEFKKGEDLTEKEYIETTALLDKDIAYYDRVTVQKPINQGA